MVRDLQSTLARWDGKNTAPLVRAYQKFHNRTGFLDSALMLCRADDPNIPTAASWLVKHAIDDGVTLAREQVSDWLSLLGDSDSWPVLLHVLQTVRLLEPDATQIKSSWTALKRLRQHDNRMVQTWVIDAMARLADRHSPYRRTVRKVVEQISDDVPASTRARIRNLRKELDWLGTG